MNTKTILSLVLCATVCPSVSASADEWAGLNVGGSIDLISEETGSGTLTQMTTGLMAGYNYSIGDGIVLGGDIGIGFGAYTASLKAGYDIEGFLLFGTAGLMDVESGFEPALGVGISFKPSSNTIVSGEYLMGSGTSEFLAVTEEFDASLIRVSYALQF